MTNMDLMAVLSTVVLMVTIVTTFFAVAAYAVSRGYTKKRPTRRGALPPGKASAPEPILKRYNPYHANA